MINKVILQGRLTKQPELRRTQSNTAVTSFTLACDRPPRKGADKVTDFVDCVAWSGTAEFVSKYFGKGQLMLVCGSLQARDWEDKNGQKRRSWEVIIQEAHFCESKREAKPDGNIDASDFDDYDGMGELPF